MNNIVDLGTGRSRPRRSVQAGQDGAQILFFTGVRYERLQEHEAPSFVPETVRFCENLTAGDVEASAHGSEVPVGIFGYHHTLTS